MRRSYQQGSAAERIDGGKPMPLGSHMRHTRVSSAPPDGCAQGQGHAHETGRPPRDGRGPVPGLTHELGFWRAGVMRVAGLDEVGRGPLAGPVLAAAVVLPPFFDAPWLARVRDSKMLLPRAREELAAYIRAPCAVGLGASSAADIDRVGLAVAVRAAMTAAIAALGFPPDHLLLDALVLPDQPMNQTGIVHGDARCVSIACASIVAKVERDALMAQLDALYPGYDFARHKGYGTAAHLRALERLGPSPAHRRSFAPVRARETRTDNAEMQ